MSTEPLTSESPAIGTGRFDPENDRLRKSLAWHASVTVELQGRVLEASRYVRSHSVDPKLLAILEGDERAKRLWSGIDTTTQVEADS